MSRIGRRPVVLPTGVTVTEQDRVVRVTGPKGALSQALSSGITVRQEGVELIFERKGEDRRTRAYHGLMRNLIANMVKGVSVGFEKKLEIKGVGYKAEVNGRELRLNLGYSHPVVVQVPEGLAVAVDRQTRLSVTGIDAQRVGQLAAEIRRFRVPDAYKGKGIRYEGEVVKTKPGKAAAAS